MEEKNKKVTATILFSIVGVILFVASILGAYYLPYMINNKKDHHYIIANKDLTSETSIVEDRVSFSNDDVTITISSIEGTLSLGIVNDETSYLLRNQKYDNTTNLTLTCTYIEEVEIVSLKINYAINEGHIEEENITYSQTMNIVHDYTDEPTLNYFYVYQIDILYRK